MSKSHNNTLDNSLLPPQHVETEEVIIGVLLAYSDAIDEVATTLKAEHFYKESNQIIYRAILSVSQSKIVDVMTVMMELKNSGDLELIGGLSELTRCMRYNMPTDRVNLNSHIDTIIEDYNKRVLIQISHESFRRSYSLQESFSEIVTDLDKKIFDLYATSTVEKDVSIVSGLTEAKKAFQFRKDLYKKGDLSGIDTGFKELNERHSGWQKGDLVVIAARPSMGKTAVALQAARTAAKNDKPVMFFTLEMSKTQLVNRIIIGETAINPHRFKHGIDDYSDEVKLNDFEKKFVKWPLYIDDFSSTIESIKLSFKKTNKKLQKEGKKIEMIIIDYLQLINRNTMDKGLRTDEKLSIITKFFKKMAKEENIVVMILSQLNRDVEKRGGDKKPMLSDLKESGSTEEDADVVLLLYRAEYYGRTVDESGTSTEKVGEIITAKFRNGDVGVDKYRHDGTMNKFYPYKEEEFKNDMSANKDFLPF